MAEKDIKLVEPKIEPLNPALDAALKNNKHVDIIRLKGGSLIVTEIVSEYLVGCDDQHECTEFAEFTILFVCGDGSDLVANLCPYHLRQHVDFAKSNPAYITH